MDQTDISEDTNSKFIVNTNVDVFDNNNNMNEEKSQVTESSKDAKVSEYLNGINAFIKKMENAPQFGGGNSVVSNERAKIAKLFNVLSIETLLSEVRNNSSVVSNTEKTNETKQ
jgi:hypothetical protein